MLDPPPIPISDSKSSGSDGTVICLELGDEVAPTTGNGKASLEQMDRALPIDANAKKMCRKFDRLMALDMHWIMRDWHLEKRIVGTMHFPEKHTTANIFDSLLNVRIDFGEWPKKAEGSIPQSEEALKFNEFVYSVIEPPRTDCC